MHSEQSVFIHHCASDKATLIHDAASGRLVAVTRNAPRGATIIDRAQFDAAVARADAYQEDDDPPRNRSHIIAGWLVLLLALVCVAVVFL